MSVIECVSEGRRKGGGRVNAMTQEQDIKKQREAGKRDV